MNINYLKVTGKCGSIWVRLIPAPRGTGIVSAPVPKKLLQMAGIEDCYTSAKGSTGTLGNFGEQTCRNVFRRARYQVIFSQVDLWVNLPLQGRHCITGINNLGTVTSVKLLFSSNCHLDTFQE